MAESDVSDRLVEAMAHARKLKAELDAAQAEAARLRSEQNRASVMHRYVGHVTVPTTSIRVGVDVSKRLKAEVPILERVAFANAALLVGLEARKAAAAKPKKRRK